MGYLKKSFIRISLFLFILTLAAAFKAQAAETRRDGGGPTDLHPASYHNQQTEFPDLRVPQRIGGFGNNQNQFGYLHPHDRNLRRDQEANRARERAYYQGSGGCNRRIRCPGSDMSQVCHPNYEIKVCIDTDLVTDENGLPRGSMSYDQCEAHCTAQGKRLPSNNEWMVAALGTDRNACLPPGGAPAQEGYAGRTTNGRMNDASFNIAGLGHDRRQCVSTFGVRDMIGTLGQHVTHGMAQSGRTQFNGGFWGMPHSSIFYRTVFHEADHTDFSTGCRCAWSPE